MFPPDSADSSLSGPPPFPDKSELGFPESEADQQEDGEDVEGEHWKVIRYRPFDAYYDSSAP